MPPRTRTEFADFRLPELLTSLATESDVQRLIGKLCANLRERISAGSVAAIGQGSTQFDVVAREDGLATVPEPAKAAIESLGDADKAVLPCGEFEIDQPGWQPKQSLLIAPIRSPARLFGWLVVIDPLPPAEELLPLIYGLAVWTGRMWEHSSLCSSVLADAVELEEQRTVRQWVESEYQGLVDHIRDAMIALTPDGHIHALNRAFEEICGWPRGQWLTKAFSLLVHSEDLDRVQAYLHEVQAEDSTKRPLVFRARTNPGGFVWLELTARRQMRGGELNGLICVARNVTVRRLRERQAAVKQAVSQILLDRSPMEETASQLLQLLTSQLGWEAGVFWLADESDQELRPVVRQATDPLPASIPRALATDDPAAVAQAFRTGQVVATSAGDWCGYAIPLRTDVETLGVLEMYCSEPIHADEQLVRLTESIGMQVGGHLEHLRAESALKSVEQQLWQSQKMESVWRMAGWVAHDFNNLLTAITGFTDLAQSMLEPSDPKWEVLKEYLGEVSEAADKAAVVTRQLLVFGRHDVVVKQAVDLSRLVSDFTKIVRRLLGEDIELVLETGPVAETEADPSQLEQVLLNLVVNARDAMPRGGLLTVRTRNVHLVGGRGVSCPIEQATHVELDVADTGCGMDESTLANAAEPFFTTKSNDRGTGLGLATVIRIVEAWQGKLVISSELGQGTTMTVRLPASRRQAPAADAGGGTATILIVEDDEAVRMLAVDVLQAAGYSVLDAACGEEGLQLVQSQIGQIDLLLTDVVLPDLNGPKLAEKALRHRPELAVLFMSGYVDHDQLRGEQLDMTRLIRKPFTPKVLTRRISDALAAKG